MIKINYINASYMFKYVAKLVHKANGIIAFLDLPDNIDTKYHDKNAVDKRTKEETLLLFLQE